MDWQFASDQNSDSGNYNNTPQANFDDYDLLEEITAQRHQSAHKSEYVRRSSNMVIKQPESVVKLLRSGESLGLGNQLRESDRYLKN